MTFCRKENIVILSVISVIYLVLTIISIDNCYFWDVIQQVSKEAHWFYRSGFASLLIPADNEFGIFATGYHPPFLGIITAALWKIFGYNLYVSHLFMLFWLVLLIYNLWKLIDHLFPGKYLGWIVLLILLEPAVLSQYVIASPDFIILTAFVISLRAILEHKPVMLAVALIFICCINMRGVFLGVALFLSNCYFDYHAAGKTQYSVKAFFKTLRPYLPVLLILTTYYAYFFISKGWFFNDSPYAEAYTPSTSIKAIAVHFMAFILRSIESGRIIIWGFALYFIHFVWKNKIKFALEDKTLILLFIITFGVYFIFVFITQMPFSSRYFMPHFLVLSLLVFRKAVQYFNAKTLRIVFSVVLVFTLTGHFWIYPEKVSQPWDSTLLHMPYYELRKKCFNYIDAQKLDYKDLAGGFCLYGDRGYMELSHEGKIVGRDETMAEYFIYSNISNLEDERIDALKNSSKWTVIQHFEKWPVFITIYQKNGIEEEK